MRIHLHTHLGHKAELLPPLPSHGIIAAQTTPSSAIDTEGVAKKTAVRRNATMVVTDIFMVTAFFLGRKENIEC